MPSDEHGPRTAAGVAAAAVHAVSEKLQLRLLKQSASFRVFAGALHSFLLLVHVAAALA